MPAGTQTLASQAPSPGVLAMAVQEVVLEPEGALGLYQCLGSQLEQAVLLRVVLLMMRAEEDDAMGHPWSCFLDQLDKHQTVRGVVDQMMGQC